jgi:hypothetical protein
VLFLVFFIWATAGDIHLQSGNIFHCNSFVSLE